MVHSDDHGAPFSPGAAFSNNRTVSNNPGVLASAPLFEKMLYDNARLARVYLPSWQLTENDSFWTSAQDTLDYVAREMQSADGAFYSTQDADTEGEEGKFYVWTAEELRSHLGDQADEFMAAYGVNPSGNWEGKDILELVGTVDQRNALAETRRDLFEVRQERVGPGRDEKVLASWNGLMLAAFAEAAVTWALAGDTERGDPYSEIAEQNAKFLLDQMRDRDGELFHTWKAADGGTAESARTIRGFLEDYAKLAEGLLGVYQATFDPHWYQAARDLVDAAAARFWVPG